MHCCLPYSNVVKTLTSKFQTFGIQSCAYLIACCCFHLARVPRTPPPTQRRRGPSGLAVQRGVQGRSGAWPGPRPNSPARPRQAQFRIARSRLRNSEFWGMPSGLAPWDRSPRGARLLLHRALGRLGLPSPEHLSRSRARSPNATISVATICAARNGSDPTATASPAAVVEHYKTSKKPDNGRRQTRCDFSKVRNSEQFCRNVHQRLAHSVKIFVDPCENSNKCSNTPDIKLILRCY